MNTHYSDTAAFMGNVSAEVNAAVCGLGYAFVIGNPARVDCPDCQAILARLASRAPVEFLPGDHEPEEADREIEALHAGQLTPDVSAERGGQLWEREAERSARMLGHFSALYGVIERQRGPILARYAEKRGTYAYYSSGRIRAGVRV